MPRRVDKPPAPVRQFYRSVVDEAAELVEAAEVQGLDQEVALLRIQLRRHIEEHPEDFALMLKGVELIVRAMAARYRMSPKSAQDLSESIEETLRRLGDELFPQRVTDV